MDIQQIALNTEFERLLNNNIHERLHGGESDIYASGDRGTISLSHAIQDYKAGRIAIPPHQRDKCWSRQREKAYLMTISSDGAPPGSFEFYQLILPDGRKSAKFLNDGSQRLRVAMSFLEQPNLYGVTIEDISYLLDNTTYPYTLKVHRSHQEAMRRFQIVNNNLQLTNYQKVIGDLIYCEGDDQREYWENLIDDLHNKLYNIALPVVINPYPNRNTKTYWKSTHSRKRHDLSLFWRFLSSEREETDYRPYSDIEINKVSINHGLYFEQELATAFKTIGKEMAKKKIGEFIRLIENETALIDHIWNEIKKNEEIKEELEGRVLTSSCYRWLLDVAIWTRNKGRNTNLWEEFLYKFLERFKGGTVIIYEIEPDNFDKINVSISRPGVAKRICQVLNCDLVEREEKRTRKIRNKKPGWHESHKEPFSIHGNGETFLEPAITNLSRGAQPVEASQ